MNDLLRSLAVLGGGMMGVALVTLGLVAAVVPTATALATPIPTEVPLFDLAVPPQQVGGVLEVTGVRSGTIVVNDVYSNDSFKEGPNGFYPVLGDLWVAGDEGKLVLDHETGSVNQVDFEGLLAYPEPDECGIEAGALNERDAIVSALVDCPDLEDVRGKGTFSVRGVVGIPGIAIGVRGGLPPTGGDLVMGSSTLHFSEIVAPVTSQAGDDDLIVMSAVLMTDEAAERVLLQWDDETAQFMLIGISEGDDAIGPTESCPVSATWLGDLGFNRTATRLAFDCSLERPDETVRLEGELVVDFIGIWPLLQPPS